LLALINGSSSPLTSTPQVTKVPMENIASSSNIAMTGIDFSHSLFSA